jgi:hypothetical protein
MLMREIDWTGKWFDNHCVVSFKGRNWMIGYMDGYDDVMCYNEFGSVIHLDLTDVRWDEYIALAVKMNDEYRPPRRKRTGAQI